MGTAVTIKTWVPITKSPFRANSLTLVYMDLLLDICKSTSISAFPAHGDHLESDHLHHVSLCMAKHRTISPVANAKHKKLAAENWLSSLLRRMQNPHCRNSFGEHF